MKKCIVICLLVGLIGACSPVFIRTMSGVEQNYKTGLKKYAKNDFNAAIKYLGKAIDDVPLASQQYARDSAHYLTDEGLNTWYGLKYEVNTLGRAYRAYSYYQVGDYNSAMLDVNEVILDYQKSGCSGKEIEKTGSVEACKAAIELVIYTRAFVFYAGNQYAEAAEDFDWVVDNGSHYTWVAMKDSGLMYQMMGNYDAAYARYSRLIDEFPDYALYYALRCETGYRRYQRTVRVMKPSSKFNAVISDCDKAMALESAGGTGHELAIKVKGVISNDLGVKN